MLLYTGCSTQQKYRVLSFFFDGVPPPGGWPTTQPSQARGPGGSSPAAAATSQPVVYIYHPPYAGRRCFDCHDREHGNSIDNTNGVLCRKCHGSYFTLKPGDWEHGPVAARMCSLCHEPHKSQYKGLLTQAQPGLCLTCHNPQDIFTSSYHAKVHQEVCTTCHDPHKAGNRLLLADSHTYQLRHVEPVPPTGGHALWDNTVCTKCHIAAESNKLISDVDRVCVTCHAKVQHPGPGIKLHQAVVEGKCTICHTPHRSSRPHLIRDTAEQMCFKCHKLSEITTPQHPPVYRADCLICHHGHRSSRPYLLRAGIPLPPGAQTQPALPPTPAATQRATRAASQPATVPAVLWPASAAAAGPGSGVRGGNPSTRPMARGREVGR